MNVVYSSSDSYAEICGISILSLLENNKDVDSISIYIIDNEISDVNKRKLKEVVDNYKRKLRFTPKIDIEKIAKTKINVGRWNIGTFYRLFLGFILPKSVEKTLYLDCDTIVRHSLKEVYNLDLGDSLVAGADDCRSDLYRVNIGSIPGTVYINNGFMLIDLKKWRENNVEKEFVEYINMYKGDITYMDQGVLNGVFGPKEVIYELSPIYNAQRIFFDFSYINLLKLRKPEYHCSEKDYDETVSDPKIVHFTPTFLTGTRPWNIKDNHKFTPEYREYKEMSPWKTEPYRLDDRKITKKIMTTICRFSPKNIMLMNMSYLHSKWYPKKRMKIMNKNKEKKA